MSGRLGGVKVVILPNRDFAADDPANSHTHAMFFQDGSSTQPKQQVERGRRQADHPPFRIRDIR